MVEFQLPEPTIAWLAGLFEGEGNIDIAKNGGTRLTIRMTDRDVIERVHAIFPCTRIQVVQAQPRGHVAWAPDGTPTIRMGNMPKEAYAWRISDPETVRTILELMLPWFGERRAVRAREALHHLDTRPGRGGNAAKTHCKCGHEFTPENTYIPPNRPNERHCRTCLRQWSRDYRLRKGRPVGYTKGEKHAKAKLTKADVWFIRASTLGQRVLAERFGVSQSQISNVRLRKTWKHVS